MKNQIENVELAHIMAHVEESFRLIDFGDNIFDALCLLGYHLNQSASTLDGVTVDPVFLKHSYLARKMKKPGCHDYLEHVAQQILDNKTNNE